MQVQHVVLTYLPFCFDTANVFTLACDGVENRKLSLKPRCTCTHAHTLTNLRIKSESILWVSSRFGVNDASIFDNVADHMLIAAELVDQVLPPRGVNDNHVGELADLQ